ncbi:hypothetical protein HMSSN139_07820 [Paenibacillus sp. HMSSN-139]|nr:hypothetical protein HMSSN139_07820 [Paenibacillus sp. HMSSN-139]
MRHKKDSSKRVRDARNHLKAEGIKIYSGYDNAILLERGLKPIKKEEFIALYDRESSLP